MITPQKAPVRPRVLCPNTGAALPLEDELRPFIESEAKGCILLVGGLGMGKTTALQHLAATFPDEDRLLWLDGAGTIADVNPHSDRRLVVNAVDEMPGSLNRPERHLATFALAGWDRDEVIEYLLSAHKDKCAAVMKRLAPPSIPWLQGIPELWRAVLDELARDESLADANAAMRRYLTRCMLSVDRRRAGAAALSALVESNHLQAELAVLIEGRFRALRHRPVQLLLAAERLADDLREGHAGFLSRCLPRELIEGVAAAIFGDVRAALRLLALLELPGRTPAMAASILHCLPGGWRPKEVRSWQLPGAFLSNAAWAGVEMRRAHLERVDLCQADLTGAMLEHSYLDSAQLRGARLAGALLTSIHATKADFYGADLSGASAKSARFLDANLARANLAGAVLREADLSNANLADACLERADLTGATLTGAVLSGADFTDANLEGAYLQHLVLRDADFTGSSFVAANLRHCDLEEMNLPAADFARANLQCAVLTGSKVHGANFCAANLSEAGLADIDWEGADLRMANLTNASFHLGSSRSGRVGSPVAMEGSMTGFYTDDFEEQRFKSPEDIRKANLCGADLRGAKVMDTDFYLVDLRSAKYDPEQEEHFRRCRAILENVD